MEPVKIRQYRSEDFERLFEIDHQAFPEEIAYSQLELQYYVRSRKCRTLVAEDEAAEDEAAENEVAQDQPAKDQGAKNEAAKDRAAKDRAIVGFVIGCSEAHKLGHIITIDVTPHRQRQQIGTRLLSEIESWLWSRGADAIYLETPVDDSGARAFYDKHGYFIFERLGAYYTPSLDAFLMIKTSKRSIS